jgi:hypothetical protein
MKTTHTIALALAAAIVTSLAVPAFSAPIGSGLSGAQKEFVNQPCRTDEGYGRWTSCDVGD